MKRIEDVDAENLRWTRTGDPHSYQLLDGSEPVAILRWEKPVGSLATGETAAGRWTLKRGGFLSPSVTVRDRDSGAELAVLHVQLRTSSLQVRGGSTYTWTRTGFWVPAWQFEDPNGVSLVHFEPVRKGVHLEGGLVEVSAQGKGSPNLLLLLVLGWYFVVLAWIEDESAAAVGAVIAAVSWVVIDGGPFVPEYYPEPRVPRLSSVQIRRDTFPEASRPNIARLGSTFRSTET